MAQIEKKRPQVRNHRIGQPSWPEFQKVLKFLGEYRGAKLVIMFYGFLESVILATTLSNILPHTEHIHRS